MAIIDGKTWMEHLSHRSTAMRVVHRSSCFVLLAKATP